MRKLSLQWRITLLTALVLLICSMSLTAVSILNAQNMLVPFMYGLEAVPGMPTTRIEDATQVVSAVPAEKVKRSFDIRSILFGVIFTILGTGAVYVVTGKALRPVRELSRSVSTVDEHSLSDRLPEVMVNDEVGELTRGFNRMLSRLDEAFLRQKRFTASAAHELKTPLATIKAGVQVLHMDQNATVLDYEENARMIEASINRLSQVVEGLLLIATTGEDAGGEIEEIYLTPMFEAIQSELEPHYEKIGIVFENNCNEIMIRGNAMLLYHAFFNLVENACKYNHNNGHVRVAAQKGLDSIIITIQDDGHGISAEHHALVFEAFYRVDNSRSRKTAGSGLGLSIVKAIVERHNGTITLDSQLNQGTCFYVNLPQ